jgi:FAD:protein FMN transferase
MNEFRRYERLMGSNFEFIILNPEENGLLDQCVQEVRRIEKLLTEFSEDSQTAQLNSAAGQHPVAVDAEVYALIQRCKVLSDLTQGAFDITSGSLKKLYNFKGVHFVWPTDPIIQQRMKSVGYKKIKMIAPQSVFLETAGMHIAFAAIGKGYAADRVKKLLLDKGVVSGVINASGDLTAWGKRLDGTPWKVGVSNPNNPEHILAWLPVENGSVATSGDYEQYLVHEGIRYAHNIDPKTGRPVRGIKSVTVISSSAELSDALATAVFVMGVEVGLHLLNQLQGVHGLVVDEFNRVFTSSHLKINQHDQVAA